VSGRRGAALRLWSATARALEVVTVGLFALLVIVVLWGVVSRYIPGIIPSDWTEELAVYLLVWVSLLGSALTYRVRGHLGVDFFVYRFHPDAQRLAAIAIELCVIVFAAIGLCYGGYRLVADTLAAGQLTPVLQWRVGYLYAAVPISGIFFVAFAIEHLLEPPQPAATAEAPAA
jgi:TRAP-type C4-dicarboxylate transport system permease small subunit